LNIGVSYYSSRDFDKLNLKYSPSGYFGIGFLACFMLSDDVCVRTSHWKDEMEYELHFVKNDKFITKTEKRKSFSGTEIRLNLNQFLNVFAYSNDNDFVSDSTMNVENKITEFLSSTFWNLNINWIDKNVILCSVKTNSFFEFAQERIDHNFGYTIDLSKYLIGIEGIIHLSDSEVFTKVKNLTGINNMKELDAIKKGEISISNDIKKSFSFIKHFYTFDQVFSEIMDEVNEYNSFIFFPTKDSIIEIDGRIRKELELNDSEIKEYFRLYSWNCLCLKNVFKFASDNRIMFRINRHIHSFDDHEKLFYEQFSDFLGYSPSCFIEVYGLDTKRLSSVIYMDNITFFQWGNLEGTYWLKQARIRLSNFIDQALNFIFFKVDSITMRITNTLIKPDSSRKYIIGSSGDILKEAICLCVFLWIYDQIKTNEEAINSIEYVKQLILENWDFENDLLRSEKKPV